MAQNNMEATADAAADDQSESDSSSTCSDDVEMDQEDEALRTKLDTLNEQISNQPTSYDLLVEKIQLLRSMGELKELRKTRGTLSKLYPLTPQLWLEWINDESNLVTDNEGKKDIIDLFELAVKDYQSIKIWHSYIQFLREMGSEHITECRAVAERALAAIGLHVPEGRTIWDSYREYESEFFTAESKDEDKARYTAICFRQLAVPLKGMGESYDKLKTELKIDEPAERNYRAAFERLKSLEVWETQLVEAGNSAAAYKEYIKYEKSEKSNPARILCLFERAVCDNALDNSVWLDYINYASNELQIGPVVLTIAERASRNCPWDVSIWMQWLTEVEKFSGDTEDVKEKIKAVFERGLECCTTGDQAGSLWLKYIQFLRRRVNFQDPDEAEILLFMRILTAAEEHLIQLMPEPREYIGEILLFGIRLQAQVSKAMTKPRKLWYQALHKGYGQQFKLWIQYFQLEQRYGEVISTRKCLEKAMSVMSDGLDIVAELWLNFERDFGDLKSMQHAETKIGEFLGRKYEADLQTKEAYKTKAKFQKGKGKRQWNNNQDQDQHDGMRTPKFRKFDKPKSRKHSGEGESAEGHKFSKDANAAKFEKKTQRKPPKSFVPRSLQVHSNAAAASTSQIEATTSSDTPVFKKPLTNADFKDLFKKS